METPSVLILLPAQLRGTMVLNIPFVFKSVHPFQRKSTSLGEEGDLCSLCGCPKQLETGQDENVT